ncbi:MAG: histidinol-phosphate transaminase [Betaproteobacteria bacterium]|nr:histidinol-phosphate transaminase [Betaproteobacteria bacterium]
MDICEQSPTYIRAIAPYEPGKPISELAREYGLDERSIIKLASNENPLGFSPRAREAIERELAEVPRYPDGNAFALKAALSKRFGKPMASIVVGNGSNDLLELVASAFLAPGRASVFSQHAFAVYPLATQARGARSIVVPAKNFGHDLPAMLAAITPETRVVFIANPNNPTGTFVDAGDMEAFLGKVPGDIVVVVDEAYTDYLPPERRYDCARWLDTHRNLVVTRTFSKVYGLAGLRVGFALCDPGVADLLNRVRQPFNVNSLALAAATAALEDREFVERSFQMNREGMLQLERGFDALGLEYIPSCGNFISVRIPRAGGDGKPQAGAVFERLLRLGVIVRPVAGYQMPDHLRVTVGLPQENEGLLGALRKILKD